jgi:hypothetical protein
MLRTLLLLLLVLLVPLLIAGSSDPGILLELDRENFSLQARDLSAGLDGPMLQVALGSPAHPTPAGAYPLYAVVLNPGWEPGTFAASQGARGEAPSPNGPLGVGKIPFAEKGEIAVHGGADPLVVGKRVSLGCVRTLDEEFLALVAWLEERGALASRHPNDDGEIEQFFRRPARVIVR